MNFAKFLYHIGEKADYTFTSLVNANMLEQIDNKVVRNKFISKLTENLCKYLNKSSELIKELASCLKLCVLVIKIKENKLDTTLHNNTMKYELRLLIDEEDRVYRLNTFEEYKKVDLGDLYKEDSVPPKILENYKSGKMITSDFYNAFRAVFYKMKPYSVDLTTELAERKRHAYKELRILTENIYEKLKLIEGYYEEMTKYIEANAAKDVQQKINKMRVLDNAACSERNKIRKQVRKFIELTKDFPDLVPEALKALHEVHYKKVGDGLSSDEDEKNPSQGSLTKKTTGSTATSIQGGTPDSGSVSTLAQQANPLSAAPPAKCLHCKGMSKEVGNKDIVTPECGHPIHINCLERLVFTAFNEIRITLTNIIGLRRMYGINTKQRKIV